MEHGRRDAQAVRRHETFAKPEDLDALHVAGGTIARADEIWTTDEKLVRGYEAGLLTAVTICLPYLRQLRIPFKQS